MPAGPPPRPRFPPALALALAVLALGFSAIFVKWAAAPGPVSAFYRVAVAAAVMALPFARQARRHGERPGRPWAIAALAGLFFAADLALWNSALNETSAANATLLGNSAPVWVALWAALVFREKLPPRFWLGLALALLGACLIVARDFLDQPRLGLADLMALAAGLCYAAFFVAAQVARRGVSALTAFWLSAAASALALWLLTLFLGQPLTGYGPAQVAAMLAMALVTQVGAYLAINHALGHLPASVVSPTLLGQPVLTALLAVPLLGEPLAAYQLAGGALVLGGIVWIHRSRAG